MSRLARIFQVKHFLLFNALFWSILGMVAFAQYYSYTLSLGQTFVWSSIIRHPGATYLSFWILSFLVFDLYLLTRSGARKQGRRPWFWLVHSLGSIAFGLLHKTLSYVVGLLLERLFLMQETKTWRELIDLWSPTLPDALYGALMYFLILFVLLALDYRQRLRDEQVFALELQHQLSQSQLQAMKMQLQPHFLFNALNTIAMMVRRKKATEAIGMIANLSEMLRNNLKRKRKQFIPLQEELHLIDQYLAIEKIRFQDRLQVIQRIQSASLPLLVPNLILQPVVENAFKHGIAKSLHHARLEIRTRVEKQTLILEVFNTGDALPDGWNLHDHQGIGLGNTVNRLMRLYRGNFRFQITEQEDGVLVRITVPLMELPEEVLSGTLRGFGNGHQ